MKMKFATVLIITIMPENLLAAVSSFCLLAGSINAELVLVPGELTCSNPRVNKKYRLTGK